MEFLGLILIVSAFLFFLEKRETRISKQSLEERMMLIRELSVSAKTNNVTDYIQNVPEYENKKEEKIVIKDEIVEIDQVSPEVLLRAISK